MFVGLKNVKDLHIEDMDFSAEYGSLAPFASKLTISVALHILSHTNAVETVKTFFGDEENPVVAQTVDLRFNDFSKGLLQGSFSGLTHVEALHLQDSNIYFLHPDMFKPIYKTLMRLNLADNHLVTIPNNMFEGIKSNIIMVHLQGNKFNCNCNLNYLIEIVKGSNTFDEPLCKEPSNLSNQALKNISLDCNSTEEPPFSTTNEITSAPTFTSSVPTTPTLPDTSSESSSIFPTPSTPLINLECINFSDKQIITSSESFQIKTRSTNFQIMEDNDQRVYVEIEDMCTGSILLWFYNSTVFSNTSLDIEVGTHYGCAIHFEKILEIPNLIFNKLYIFCLIEHGKTEISPFDCIAYMLENRDEAWISKTDRSAVIAIFIVTLLGSLFCGAILMFLCLKLIPYIQMKRNERKESQTSEYEDIDYSSTSNNYITPSAPRQSVHSMGRYVNFDSIFE